MAFSNDVVENNFVVMFFLIFRYFTSTATRPPVTPCNDINRSTALSAVVAAAAVTIVANLT